MATLDPHPVSRAGGVRGLLLLLAFIGAVIGSVHWGLDRLAIINKPSAKMVLLRQVRGSHFPDTGTNRDVYLAWNGDRERPVCVARAASDNYAGGREDAIFLETATDSGCQRTIDKLTGQPR